MPNKCQVGNTEPIQQDLTGLEERWKPLINGTTGSIERSSQEINNDNIESKLEHLQARVLKLEESIARLFLDIVDYEDTESESESSKWTHQEDTFPPFRQGW